MTKRTRQPIPEPSLFAMRGKKVKWPTMKGAFLTDQKVADLKKMAFGVIFLEGDYNTRLNFDKKDSTERAIFFEHLHKVDGEHIFLLIWIGNYHNGCIFHCAWQFPQMHHWNWDSLEKAALGSYKRIAEIMYKGFTMDKEVAAICEQV